MPFIPHFNLQSFNTLGVPATAQFYVAVTDDQELVQAIRFASEKNFPLLILGGGSNIVLRDDFPGLAVHIKTSGKRLIKEDKEYCWLKVEAGENWHALVNYCLDNHYWGLENLSLIPGSVGAAPIQNIGAYGVELEDIFEELSALEVASGVTRVFNKQACEFGYRDSIFKHRLRDQYVITSVTFKLRKQPSLQLNYPALRDALTESACKHPTPREVSDQVCEIRRRKLPDPAQIPNVGSFFKNPVISEHQHQLLKEKYPQLVAYAADDDQVKLAAGWLIDQAGWRGFQDGPVAVHAQQALVLTNPGFAKGDKVLALAEKIQASVLAQYGVNLEPEPRIYP